MRQSTTASNDSTPFPRVSIVGVGCRATGPEFDRDWFGISAADAAGLDPRHRVSLEIAVEALDDAGLGCAAPGSAAAVILGAAAFTTPNAARLLSRALDLHGPSLLVDSAADTPLIAVDTAVRLLADPAIPFVLAGGTDLTVLPDISGIHLSGDGDLCTVLVLQRTADATRTGTRRYADIDGPTPGSPTGLTRILLHDHTRTPPPPHGGTGRARTVETNTAPTGNGDTQSISDSSDIPQAGHAPAPLCSQPSPAPTRTPDLLPIILAGPDTAAVRALALHWADRVGAYRDIHEFATATGRLLPEPTRAVVLARDTSEAATQLRILAARIPAAPPATAHRKAAVAGHRSPGSTARQANSDRSPRSSVPATQRGAAGAPPPVAAHGGHGGGWPAAGRGDGGWEGVELPALRWATPAAGDIFGPASGQRDGGLLFLFSGSGFHPRMGRALAGRYPVFARRLTEAVDAVVAAGGPRVWTPRHGFGNCSTGVDFTQPAVFVYQVALATLLEFWGVLPDAVAGHGAGEIAAAVAGGALLLADAARIVVTRARLLHRAGEESAAAVLEATPAEALRLVEPMRTAVGLAAIHGPSSVTVAGEPRYIDALVRRAHRRAIFAQRIAANGVDDTTATVIHIPRARTIAPQLISTLSGLTPTHPDCPIYSTTRRGAVITGPAADTANPLVSSEPTATPDSSSARESSSTPARNSMEPGAARPAPMPNRVEYDATHAAAIRHPARLDATHFGPVRGDAANAASAPGDAAHELAGSASAQRDTGLDSAPAAAAVSDPGFASACTVMNAEYWGANAAGPVELAAALEQAVVDGVSMVVELSPQPVLAAAVRDYGALRDGTYSTGSTGDEAGALLRVLAQLHVEGRVVDWPLLGAHTVTPPRRLWRRTDSGAARDATRAGAPVEAVGVHPSGAAAGSYSVPGDGRWLGPLPGVMVRGDATYVVAGGLGAYGATAVRWLLDAGARDVVVLTRVPRALPVLLEGLEERVVMVRCDVADRRDLGGALHDIRECGLPIRGLVYARPEPVAGIAEMLAELTAGDPIEFAWLLGDGGWRRMARVSGADGVPPRE